MRRSRLASFGVALLCMAFSACASEAQRYQENKARAHLSPKAKAYLSATDIDQIARLVAHSSRKRILGISAATKQMYPHWHGDVWEITVGLPWSSQRWDYGVYTVARQQGAWRIIRRGEEISLSIVGLSMQDPPDE